MQAKGSQHAFGGRYSESIVPVDAAVSSAADAPNL
jgi:hypothetical protein